MPKVKAAVLERSRRSTAGKRMSSLLGKAQEDDDAFWSHSIWSETGGGFSSKGSRKRRRDESGESSSSSGSEGGSDDDDDGSLSDGEGSYRMSEDDSDAAVDKFDSDFDESESEDEEEEGEGEEEQELRAQERREAASKRKKNQRLGMPPKSSAGRELMKRKTGRMTKRGPMGEGWNEGLVLNWPPLPGGTVPVAGSKRVAPAPIQTQRLDFSKPVAVPSAQVSASIPVAPSAQPQHIPLKPSIDTRKISKRSSAPSPKRHPRACAPESPSKPQPKRHAAATTSTKEKKKHQSFTQEDLILESIKSTETENAKWLSSRKRGKEEAARLEKVSETGGKSSNNHKVSRFHSRRGCCNILTFMDMDQLPEILTRRHGGSPSRSASFGDASYYGGGSASRTRRSESVASETSQSAQQQQDSIAKDNRPKCVITGKVARYRDPKTMLGYHDIDAYKEIKRRLETGELTIPKPLQNNYGPNNGVSGQNSSKDATTLNRTKSYFPFTADLPTMFAKTKPRGADLRVMVSQGGVPVSPPRGAKIATFSTVESKNHHGIDRSTTANAKHNEKMVDSFLPKRMNAPLKISGQLPQPSTGTDSQSGIKKDPPCLTPLIDVQNNGRGKVVVGNTSEKKIAAQPQVKISNPPKPPVQPQNRHFHQSSQPIEQPQKMSVKAKGSIDSIIRKDGVQPNITITVGSTAHPDAVPSSAMHGTNGKVEIVNGGGSGDKAKSPPIEDASKIKSGADGNKDGIVPERTQSNNDKRATIEAN
eukprot:CAMPEP_0183713066 /NCGR_PEP_ID=MMETSP0737-20130205/8049_1 /TAXON_ID=385413 /ORGANISM="Thalassiosira miniscula, Strain CCMP1093" /LENGTH=760 /DNA_ID=CAMNT_0025941815 /DNA_START=284 /DNA_END=2566 /DNA_ORIENTATION=-